MVNRGVVDVLVVGAGPTGMLLAAELARRGVRVRIVDKQSGPAEFSRALGVMPRTLEMFAGIGLADEFLRQGVQSHGGKIYGKGGRLLAEMRMDDLPTRYPFILLLPQTRTETILRKHLQNLDVELEWNTRLGGFEEKNGLVRGQLESVRGNQDFTCSYLVGCDGAHSTVRKGAGMAFPGSAYEQNWLLADVRLESGLDPEFIHFYSCLTGPVVLFPLPDQIWRMVAMRPETGKVIPEVTMQEVDGLLRKNQLGHLRPGNPSWLAGFSIHHRRVEHLRKGRVLVCGDAAHIHSPAGGQGMNTGLGDAFNLGWKLASVIRHFGTEILLDSYERERLPVIAEVLKMTDTLTRMMATPAGPVAWMRQIILPWAAGWGAGKIMARKLSQLDVAYPRSLAVLPDVPKKSGGLRAGCRIPPFTLKNQASEMQTAPEVLLRHGRLALLIFSEDGTRAQELRRIVSRAGIVDWHWLMRPGQKPAEACPEDEVWTDPEGKAWRILGNPDQASWAMLRPDGILMARGTVCDTNRFDEFLGRLFGGLEKGLETSGP